MMVVSLGVMAVATALISVVPGFVLIFACVAVSGFMTMALFLAIFGSVSDIVDRPEQDRSATGLVNLANLLGTLLGPWPFGCFSMHMAPGRERTATTGIACSLPCFPCWESALPLSTRSRGRNRHSSSTSHGHVSPPFDRGDRTWYQGKSMVRMSTVRARYGG